MANNMASPRSQQVRSRRGHSIQDRAQRANEHIRTPNRKNPPVTFRGGMVGTPVHKRAQGKVRRQYYYSLGTTGAELRIPSFASFELGWRLASGILVIVLAACLVALWNAPFFQLSRAKIVGAQRLVPEDFSAALDIEGLPVVEVSPSEIEAALKEAFPELSSISVRVGLPASLTISVTERQPIITWDQEGQTRWIDETGVAFPPRGEPGTTLVAVQAEGAPPYPAPAEDEKAEDETTAEEAEAVPALPDPSAPFLPKELIQPILDMSAIAPAGQAIVYSPRYGLGWNDPQGWKVYFGQDLQNLDLKMKEYQAIVTSLTNQGTHPSLISLEFLHAPFYRLEP